MTTLAFSSKASYVPTVHEGRWIASLSDGSTVFEDKTPNMKSAWRRLAEYVNEQNLKITSLRLEAYGRRAITIPYKDDEERPQLNGYWQASRVGTFLNSSGRQELRWRGIGYVKGRTIYISWIDETGNFSTAERPLFQEKEDDDGVKTRHYDMGVILNDPI